MNATMIANMNDNISRTLTSDGWQTFQNRKARRAAQWRAHCTTLKRMHQGEMAEAKGSQTKGSQTKGSQTKGSQTKGR